MISWPLEPLVLRYINSFNKLEPLQLEWLSYWKNAFRMAEVRGFCVELIDLGVTWVKPSTFPGLKTSLALWRSASSSIFGLYFRAWKSSLTQCILLQT